MDDAALVAVLHRCQHKLSVLEEFVVGNLLVVHHHVNARAQQLHSTACVTPSALSPTSKDLQHIQDNGSGFV